MNRHRKQELRTMEPYHREKKKGKLLKQVLFAQSQGNCISRQTEISTSGQIIEDA